MATVFEQANEWAKQKFRNLRKRQGENQDVDYLLKAMGELFETWDGDRSKKWLFIWSPDSLNQLFEVGGDLGRIAVASAKLVTVSHSGGMLFGADFSTGWGTPQSKGEFVPLVVVTGKRRAKNSKKASTVVHISQFVNGTIRHPHLPPEMLAQIRDIFEFQRQFENITLEQVEIDFMRDRNPASEIALCLKIKEAHGRFMAQYPNADPLEIYAQLMSISLGLPPEGEEWSA